jgi:hypothetical protein
MKLATLVSIEGSRQTYTEFLEHSRVIKFQYYISTTLVLHTSEKYPREQWFLLKFYHSKDALLLYGIIV